MHIHLITPGGVAREGHNADVPAICALVKRLARRHEVTVVVTKQYPKPCEYQRLGARVINLGDVPRGLGRASGLVRRVRLWQYLRGCPAPDIVHSFWLGPSSELALDHPTAGDAPRVALVFGGELVGLEDIGFGGQLTAYGRRASDRALREVHAMLTCCEEEFSRLPSHCKRKRLVPMLPDTQFLRRNAGSPPQVPGHVITVSNINRVKDPETLLRAFAYAAERVPHARLTWCGLDTLNGEAQRLAATLGVGDRVQFTGLLRYEELPVRYHTAQVYLQASRHEVQAVAVCEAAAAGLAIVGTAVGIVRDLAGQRCAVTAPVRDPKALGETLVHVLTKDDIRGRLSQNAKAWAAAHHAELTAQMHEALYAELVAAR